MNIDEAIEHCKEIAESCDNKECSTEHIQLAKWLEELKELRKLFTLAAEEINVVEEGLFLYDDYLEVYKFNHKKMSDEEVRKIKNELDIISNLQIKILDYKNGKKV